MRILITGSEGQLGRALQQQLAGHTLALVDLPQVDITELEAITQAVHQAAAEVVIHCAAYTDVDGCARNPELAYRVNTLGTQNVALACQSSGAALLHISSNEVFAGTRPGGYEEWMPPSPINPYGRTKAAAEFHVRHLLPRHYIVRTSWLFAPGGRNFIHAILRRAQEQGEIRVVVDEVASPTYSLDLAQALEKLLHSGRFGTYHLVNEGACSRWAFANEILRLAGLERVPNRPILSGDYPRPSTPPPYAALRNDAGKAIGIQLRPWQEALAAYMQQYPPLPS